MQQLFWTKQELKILKEGAKNGYPLQNILTKINEINPTRTYEAVNKKLLRLKWNGELNHIVTPPQKIGFLDIETGDLKADFGIIFCYCIKDRNSDKIYEDRITLDDIKKYSSKSRDINTKEDTRIIKNLIRDMSNFTRVVGHFSSIFDLPFIRTRAMICGIDFPTYGQYCQTDTWRILKSKFKLSRNSLENSCKKLLGNTMKDHLSLSIKHGCIRGEEWAIKDSLIHCRKDVLDTERLYNAINGFMRSTKASI